MRLSSLFSTTSRCLTLFESRDKVLQIIDGLAKKIQAPVMLVGGAALPKYSYNRTTEDIDLVMSIQNAHKLGNELYKTFKFIGSNKFQHSSGIIINLCPEGIGVKGSNIKFPAPESKIPGVQYVSLSLLLAMKIQAKRLKDRGDYAELIKRNNLSIQYITEKVLPLLNDMDKKWAITLWKEAQKEL
jgi:hypothetical protein